MRGRYEGAPDAPRTARHDWWGVVLECPDPGALARFYSELLGWAVAGEDDEGAVVAPQEGTAYLGFQLSEGYVRPVWPARPGEPRVTAHLDFEVSDLPAAVEHARELGAEVADHQPQENVRVLLDPAGHPFCLYRDG